MITAHCKLPGQKPIKPSNIPHPDHIPHPHIPHPHLDQIMDAVGFAFPKFDSKSVFVTADGNSVGTSSSTFCVRLCFSQWCIVLCVCDSCCEIHTHSLFRLTVAHRVVDRLLKAGASVRIGVPDPTKYAGNCKDVVRFSWDDSDFEAALGGCKTVFCALPHHPQWHDQFVAFFSACRKQGVKHLVKLSFYHSLAQRASQMGNFVTAMGKYCRPDKPSIRLCLCRRSCIRFFN